MILESDTEHSYNLAVTAWFLADHFPELDKNLVIKLALVHDLVEIHAGDTYAFADKALLDSKMAREAAALEQLKTEWADFPDMIEHIILYEKLIAPEAKFVYALDKIMPIITIYINDGHTWKQNDISVANLRAVKASKIVQSKEIIPYYDDLMALLEESPHLISSK